MRVFCHLLLTEPLNRKCIGCLTTPSKRTRNNQEKKMKNVFYTCFLSEEETENIWKKPTLWKYNNHFSQNLHPLLWNSSLTSSKGGINYNNNQRKILVIMYNNNIMYEFYCCERLRQISDKFSNTAFVFISSW